MKKLDSSYDLPIKIASIIISSLVAGVVTGIKNDRRNRKNNIYVLKSTNFSNAK